MAFSEKFDTATGSEVERVHDELIFTSRNAALIYPLLGHGRPVCVPAFQRARFQARNVPGSVGEV